MSGTFDFQTQPDKYRERAIAIMQLGQQIEGQLVRLYEQSITAISSGLEPDEVQHVMDALDNLEPRRNRAVEVIQAAQRFAAFLRWTQIVKDPLKPDGFTITIVDGKVVITVLPPRPGSGLTANPTGQYYLGIYKVINVSGNTFQLAAPGSSTTPIDFTTDITVATIARPICWSTSGPMTTVLAGGH